MYSGALDDATIWEILNWHRTAFATGPAGGSLLKMGVLSGCGGDVSCGWSLETFTLFGFGYGLLQADLVEPYLLQYFAALGCSTDREEPDGGCGEEPDGGHVRRLAVEAGLPYLWVCPTYGPLIKYLHDLHTSWPYLWAPRQVLTRVRVCPAYGPLNCTVDGPQDGT